MKRTLMAMASLIFALLMSCNSNAQDKKIQFFNKPIQKVDGQNINGQIGKNSFAEMDIQMGGQLVEGDGIRYAIGPVLGKDTGTISTGHMSCYSLIFDMGTQYFMTHFDLDNLPKDVEGDSIVRKILSQRLTGKKVQKILIGAGSWEEDTILLARFEYLKSLLPKSTPILFFSGPNQNFLSFEDMIEKGGPDAVSTTDVIFWEDHIIVIRPENPDVFNESFPTEQLPEMMEKWKSVKKE
jgi:hypothetical protein